MVTFEVVRSMIIVIVCQHEGKFFIDHWISSIEDMMNRLFFFFFLDFVSLYTIQILLRIIICHVVRVVKSCLLKFIKKIIYKYKHL